jgi:DNA-binding LytR/AlgR family response regulator
LLPLDAILWVSGRAGKISIHSIDGELTTFGAVATLTETLGSSFQRINRNVLVNLAAVAEFRHRSHRGEGAVVLCDGRNLPVTRTYAHDLRARFIDGDPVPPDRARGASREARSAASGD